MKLKLKKDIVIKKGTVLENCDTTSVRYINNNYMCSIGLSKDSSGRLVYGYEPEDETLNEWFELIN